jgi:hypothetical protein
LPFIAIIPVAVLAPVFTSFMTVVVVAIPAAREPLAIISAVFSAIVAIISERLESL